MKLSIIIKHMSIFSDNIKVKKVDKDFIGKSTFKKSDTRQSI